MTPREVLQLHIGSCGINIGHRCWELYCLEHNLAPDGSISIRTCSDNPPECFFSKKENYCPRALFFDHDFSTMDEIRSSKFRNLYSDEQFHLLTSSSDSTLDIIRKHIENYDNFDGFIISHALNGKCSDSIYELLPQLESNYSKKTILTNSVFDSSIDIIKIHNLLNFAHVIVPMENKAILDLCKHRLEIENPTFANMNKLIATCWSHITCSMRFDGCLLDNLNEFQNILIPLPTLKLITSFLAPLIPFSRSIQTDFKSPSVYDMCVPLFNEEYTSFMHQPMSNKMALSVAMAFRGENIVPKEVGQKLICDWKKWWRFYPSVSTGFRCGINYHRPYIFDDESDIALTDKQVCILANEISASKHLCDTTLLQSNENSQREDEGMEIIEARNYLTELRNNYQELEDEIMNDQ